MKATPKRRVLAALLGGTVDKIPVTSVAGCGGTVCVDMQRATAIYFPEAHKDSVKMAELAIASHKLTGLESARVPFDVAIEPEALGCPLQWYNRIDSTPSVSSPSHYPPENLGKQENLLEKGRIPVVLEAIRIVRKTVGDFLPISSGTLGPFTLLGNLVGLGNLLRWMVLKPDYVADLLNLTKNITIEYATAQYQAGSDIVAVSDPMASEDLISAGNFREFVKPELTEIADSLRGIRVLHICGQTDKILSDMVETGFDGLSVAEKTEIVEINPRVREAKILGNVSSHITLIFGSPEDVKNEAKKALEAGVDLLEPSCGISTITPLKNIQAIVKARNEFYL
jgi:[methyl-Co(III) methanol-specific corrinoid protein]:coenzyme M methyltransferase